MRRPQFGIELQGLFQRRDGPAVVPVLQVGLAKTNESRSYAWRQLGCLAVLRNGLTKIATLLRRSTGLHVLQGLWRRTLPGEKKQYEGTNHGFSGSTTSRNWSA